MAFICLPKEKAQEFRDALKKRDIKIEELLNMESEARTKLFEKYAGTKAKSINTLFEEKLVLKNRLLGIKNLISKLGQVGRYDPKKKALLDDMLSEYRAKQQERIFSPKENEAFLKDLAEQELGTRVTREEAKNIFELQTAANKIKEAHYNESKPSGQKWDSPKSRLDYGAAQFISNQYVKSLRGESLPLKELLKGYIQEKKQLFGESKYKATGQFVSDVLRTISDTSVALVASVDNSFIGRQGLKTLQTHPSTWFTSAKQSFVDFAKKLGGKETEAALMADILSRENYINGRYTDTKLIPNFEEQFPTSIPARIPGLGRVFSASEAAFTGSAIRMRTDLFDLVSGIAEKNGVQMDNVQVKDIGKLVNSLTARGTLGKYGESPIVKLLLWSPRMLKANWDVLTAHSGGFGLETAFARKQAATNLLKIVGETALVIMIANAISPGSAETDTRSSDFGKIKIGNTRFDITGGASSLVVLASRLAHWATGKPAYKSTSTGIVSKLNTGEFGGRTAMSVIEDFLSGKTAPLPRTIIDILSGADFKGQKPTVASAIARLTIPISIQNVIDLKNDNSASAVLGAILDGVGISSNTYSATSDWSQNPGVELQQFQAKVGVDRFKEANDLYNQKFANWFMVVQGNPKYQALSEEDKQKVITKKRGDLKEEVFKKYNFTPKKSKPTKLPKL